MDPRVSQWIHEVWLSSEIWLSAGQPINVIEDGLLIEEQSDGPPTGPEAQLGAVTAPGSNYRLKLVSGRYVLYPRDAVWDRTITGLHFGDLPRYQAAAAYSQIVREQTGALSNFVGPIVKGDPSAAIYSEVVSLSESAPIVQHLVQLLGGAADLRFVVERLGDGRMVLYFERVSPGKEAGERPAP